MELNDKRLVLTGAASGIGLALLEMLAEHPLQVLAVDVHSERLQLACSRVVGKPARITPLVCDLSSSENLERLFEQALSTLGGIDIFIANAGFPYYERITAADWRHLEKIFQVNVFNTLYTIEKMESLHAGQPYKVVVTASAMAHIAVPGYAIYAATKAALDRFADGYRWQMKDPHRLMLVYPITTRSGFFQAAGNDVPIPWPNQTPQAVARAVMRGIRHDRRRVYPSSLFRLVLFLDRFLPMHWLVQRIEQRRMDQWLAARKASGAV